MTRREKVIAFLQQVWGHFSAAQDVYFAAKGHYWQGMWSHSGEVTTPRQADNLTASPSDQPEPWSEVLDRVQALKDLIEGVPVPCRLKCDVHELRGDWGYTLTVQFKLNNEIWTGSKGAGLGADAHTVSLHKQEATL